MSYLNIFFYLLLLFVINKFIDKVYAYLKTKDDSHRLLSRQSFKDMSQAVFAKWCFDFLKSAGFMDLNMLDEKGASHSPCMACTIDGSPAFIWVIHKNQKSSNASKSSFESVTLAEIEEVFGYILLNGVKKAYIITDGNFESDGADFAKKFCDRCSVTFIDGCDLTYNFIIFHGGECVEF